MKFVGAHVSTTGGVENAPINEQEIGGRALALFTRNQRQWSSKPFTAGSEAPLSVHIQGVLAYRRRTPVSVTFPRSPHCGQRCRACPSGSTTTISTFSGGRSLRGHCSI